MVRHAAALVDAFVDRRVVVDARVNARYGRLVHRVGQARERARREAIGVVRVVGVADVAPERDQRVDRGAGLTRVRRRVSFALDNEDALASDRSGFGCSRMSRRSPRSIRRRLIPIPDHEDHSGSDPELFFSPRAVGV